MKRFSALLVFTRRYKLFTVSILAAIIGLALELSHKSSVAYIIIAVVSLIATVPLLRGMYQDIQDGTYGIDILAITAIVSAVLLKEYWAAMVVVLMLTGGESLEDYAEHRAKQELDALLTRSPRQAHVLHGKKTVDVNASEVQIGDRLLVKTGEVVPVDASIIDGRSSFDQSSLTGESIPEIKTVGDSVLSGTINMEAAVTVRCLQTAEHSQYQQIIKLVQSAGNSRAPFVRLADRYSIPFTLIAYAIAGGVWIYSGQAIRFLEVIIVATPCPLLLAAPIAIISGMSRAAKQGIIVRTGSALEQLASVQSIAFDKTGTLTIGRPLVESITAFKPYTQATVLGTAAGLEIGSTHVLAQAIHQAAIEQTVTIAKVRHIQESSGQGLSAVSAGKQVLVGRISHLESQGVDLPADYHPDSQQTATYVAIGGQLAGVINFSDELRPESAATLAHLKVLGIKHISMVTGDNQAAANVVGKKLGISDITAEAFPADKLQAVARLSLCPVAFVGDGVNDAPVLTAADVGIALGARGATAASESADIVIMADDISYVARALQISRRTFTIARQSILVGIGLSVVLMILFASGRFKPIYGAAIQELVDVVVIFNALRAHSAGR